jgi:hypothetical protein
MPKYNGHDNYNAWNVCLWLYNDEGMYNLMRECVKRNVNKDKAAKALLDYLPAKTPDGVKFTYTNVRKALTDM